MRRSALAALLVLVTSGAASAGPTTVEELRARVEEARRLASQAASSPSQAGMDRVRSALGLPDVVVVVDEPVRVPADPYLARLGGTSADEFRSAVRHLDALASRLAESPRSVDADALRADLRAAYGTQRWEPGIWDRIRQWLASLLSWLGRGTGGTITGTPGLVVLVVVAAVAAGLLVRRRALSVVPEAAAGRGSAGRRPADWRRLAREARDRGDLGTAVVCLYQALVSELAARGLVEDHPSLTARELRRATALSARLAHPMADASRRYERVRYRGDLATPDDVAALERAERAARTP